MTDIPVFRLYSATAQDAATRIQPTLGLRPWGDLTRNEREIALQKLVNDGWLNEFNTPALQAITGLNREFLRALPGPNLHKVAGANDDFTKLRAAYSDFRNIFLQGDTDLVMDMLSRFAQAHIDGHSYRRARDAKTEKEKAESLKQAFDKFDRLTNWLNEVFKQFSVNQTVTRNGFAPRQDAAIHQFIYAPTMEALSDPKWRTVSDDLAAAMADFRAGEYPETITKAHAAVQRFLQIWTGGAEGKNGRGELKALINEARSQGLLPTRDRFIEPVLAALLSFLPAERATKSTAKPTVDGATQSEALLVLNVAIVLFQYCLQQSQ